MLNFSVTSDEGNSVVRVRISARSRLSLTQARLLGYCYGIFVVCLHDATVNINLWDNSETVMDGLILMGAQSAVQQQYINRLRSWGLL